MAFCFLMPLALASVYHHTNSIINWTITFLRLRKLLLGTALLFCHVMPVTSTLASHDTNGISAAICHVMQLHWCHHHVMWTTPSMATLCSLGQDGLNEVQHIFGHVTPLAPALASCDADIIDNGYTVFLRSRKFKGCEIYILAKWCHLHWHQCNLLPTALSMAT